MNKALWAASGTGPTPSRFRVRRARAACALALALAVFTAGRASWAAEPPPPSWIRFALDVPYPLLAEDLERRVTRDGGGARSITLAGGFTLEVAGERGPLQITGQGDSLRVQTRVRHSMFVQSATQPRTGCGGPDAPMLVDVRCRARVGWNESWAVEAIAVAEGMEFARRCKPDPPRINLVKRGGPVVESMFAAPLAKATAEALGAIRADEFLAAVWEALGEPVRLGEGWIDFAPEAVFVDPISLTSRGLAIRGAVRVRPALRADSLVLAAPAFPAAGPTRVRLSGDDIGVAVRVTAGLESLPVRLRAAADSVLGGKARVRDATVRAQDGGLVIDLDLDGDLAGRFTATAALDYEDLPPAVVARDAEWTPASRDLAAGLAAAERERMASVLAAVAGATRLDLNPAVAHSMRNMNANLNRRLGSGLVLDGRLHARRFLGVRAEGTEVRVDLVFSGPAVVRPLPANP